MAVKQYVEDFKDVGGNLKKNCLQLQLLIKIIEFNYEQFWCSYKWYKDNHCRDREIVQSFI